MSIGEWIGAAIDVNSNLFWWGRCGKDEEEVMPPSPISKKKLVISEVVCGGRFVAALNTEQKVHIWGRLVAGGKWMNEWRISSCERIVSMAAGRSHLVMLNDKGEVFSWGCNDHGQRGFPIENNDIVDQVKKFPFHHVCKEIACGLTSTLILTSNGDLWMCGGNPESYGYVITPENSITSVTKCEKLALGKKIASIKVGWGRHQGQYQSIYEATSVEGERLVWDDHSPPPLPSGKISKSTFIGLVSPRSNPFYVTHPRKIISSPCECHKSLEIKRITESMQIKLSALNELVLEIQNDIQLVKTARDVSLETQLIAAQEMINSLRLPKASISNQAGDGYAWD